MFKCIVFLRKKDGLSRDAFIDYYETRHAPLIRRLLPGILDYRRNFVEPDGAFLYPDAAPLDFDVVTELWLADRAAYDVFIARAAEPDVAGRIAEDEAKLFDRATMRMVIVEERASS